MDRSERAMARRHRAHSHSFVLLCAILLAVLSFVSCVPNDAPPSSDGGWTSARKHALRETVRDMFDSAFGAYLTHAFPHDELKPISRTWTDSMAEIGNAQASAPKRKVQSSGRPYTGFALTLIDSLSTLAVMGDRERFCAGVDYLVRHLSFDVDLRVHLFEANIRVLGGLLSAHLLLTDPVTGPPLSTDVWFASLHAPDKGERRLFSYSGGLLKLARDLGERLLRAFPEVVPPSDSLHPKQRPSPRADTSPLPHAFVHLTEGVLPQETEETCTAGAGTFMLEFGLLSALTDDMRFRDAADAALMAVWTLRHPVTNLMPNTFDRRGSVLDPVSSLGSGIDSSYEYLLKSYMLFDTKKHMDMFAIAYEAAERHLKISVVHDRNESSLVDARPTRSHHNLLPPSLRQSDARVTKDWYLESRFESGQHTHLQLNSLAAFFPALQVLIGKVEEARSAYASIYDVWTEFSSLPERYHFFTGELHATERHYPLRPEFVESTYHLYRATRDDLYLDAAERIVRDLNQHARVSTGGFATIRDVSKRADGSVKPLDDRMESFFLAETLKYLYLTFDDEHWLHRLDEVSRETVAAAGSTARRPITTDWIFSTEGHLFPIRARIHQKMSDDAIVWHALAKPNPEFEVWDVKRRLDQRVRLVGAEALHAEAIAAGNDINPILLEILNSATSLTSRPESMVSTSRVPSTSPEAVHKFAHLFRFREGFFHPSLVGPAANPRTFTREYEYYLARLLGEETALGGKKEVWPRKLDPPSGTPFTAVTPKSATLPPVSVRDALMTPRKLGGSAAHGGPNTASTLNALQCARPTHLALNLGGPLNFWWLYDREWLRWVTRQQLLVARVQAYEEWQLRRKLDVANQMAAAVAKAAAAVNEATKAVTTKTVAASTPASTAGGPARPPAAAAPAPTPSRPPPPAGPQFVELNGQRFELPASVANLLQQRGADAGAAAADPNADMMADFGFINGEGEGGLNGAGEEFDYGDDEFTFEEDAGSFHIAHARSASYLTVRNLGTDLLEITDEVDLRPEDERGPLLRVAAVTLDARGELVEHLLEVQVDNICSATLPTMGAHFGRQPPVLRDDAKSEAASQTFLRASMPNPDGTVFDAVAALDQMPPAGSFETGLLQGHLVRVHPLFACEPLSPSDVELVRGRLVLVERGECAFAAKARLLQASGAIGMVVWNRLDPNYLFLMGADEEAAVVRIPSVMVDDEAGKWIATCLTKHERALEAQARLVEAATRAGTAPPALKYPAAFRVAIRKQFHASGDAIKVHPFPTFKPLGVEAVSADQQPLLNQPPASISISGTLEHFLIRTQTGWMAEIEHEADGDRYILKVVPAGADEDEAELKLD